MGNLLIDTKFRIINCLSGYRKCREVCIEWCNALDSDEFFAVRSATREVFVFELPHHQVIARFPQHIIKTHLNQRNPSIILTDSGIRIFNRYINWSSLCRRQMLSFEIVDEFNDLIVWAEILMAPSIDERIIEKLVYHLPVTNAIKRIRNVPECILENYVASRATEIAEYQTLSEDFITRHINTLNADIICRIQQLSEKFIRANHTWVNWSLICKHQALSEDFMREFAANIDWAKISHYQILSTDFILEFKDQVKWLNICFCQVFTEDNLEDLVTNEILSKICWTSLCTKQILSEDFMRNYIDNLNWQRVSTYQKLSIGFIRDFADKLNWEFLRKNSKISFTRDEKIEFIDYLVP